MLPSFLRRAAAAAVLVAGTSVAAHAQTDLSRTTYLSNTGGPRVATLTFEVFTTGTFQLFTQAPHIDPNLYLFAGTSAALGAKLGFDDDGCPNSLCGSAGAYYNSLLTRTLDVGIYTLVAGAHSLDETEARTGNADLSAAGNVTLRVQSAGGTAGLATSTVPEPSTYALMGTGLLGLAAAARRRRR